MMVVVGHLGTIDILQEESSRWMHIAKQALSLLVNGTAAVMVFFIISGFCIHYPYRSGGVVDLRSFYTRRLTRISVPLVAVVALSIFIGFGYVSLVEGVLWSLIAEIIYYFLYPLFIKWRQRIGWRNLIIVAFVAAYAVVATKPHAGNYPSYGHALNWVVGLPIWLLGCLLAERSDHFPFTNARSIWFYRVMIVSAACSTLVLRYHVPHVSLGFPWTLNIFGAAAYVWVGQEIIYFHQHPPLRWMEKAGQGSYSLYLLHLPGAYLLKRIPVFNSIQGPAHYILDLLFVISSAAVFYVLIERPSHRLATYLGKRSSVLKIPTFHPVLP